MPNVSVNELAVKSNEVVAVVDSDKYTRNVALVVLASALMKPVIEFPHTAGKCSAVVFAEGLDRFDHALSTELTITALQRFDQGGRRARLAADCREKCVAIGPLQNHALMLIQQPARTSTARLRIPTKSPGQNGIMPPGVTR